MDEALALPTEKAVQIALRTQQIIAYESGVADTVDPLAGSYFVERLTNEIEARAAAYIEQIDALGGALCAIERGWMQAEIETAAYEYQQAVERKEQIVVGVNEFVSEEESEIEVLRIDDALARRQAQKLAALRAERDNGAVEQTLEALAAAARREDVNLIPYILDAVEAYATTGEICGRLREVWGEYRAEYAA
jgi:methylmalonyl-CoA mutase N-terminal domain/subunit